MTDILIRDVPDEVLAAIDTKAKRVGLSRTEYLRRALERERVVDANPVSVDQLKTDRNTCRGPRRPHRHVRRLVVTTWLIDKSAIGRLHLAANASEWAERIERGLVRISTVTRLEVGYSARSAVDHRTLVSEPPVASMPVEYLTPRIEDRALEIQSVLASRGQHRAPSIPDLLIAATAELAELTVLHLDKDFELIAQITSQPVERLDTT